ncbi:MFS permease [Trichoderma parareesei]|uniref:MFS permease n=1 Tax=Trichoderma parareesei TaxID=858221 RepID=A0A2H2ZU17_TRIPA|nr:MFS permease [Trichoderma parareesei]
MDAKLEEEMASQKADVEAITIFKEDLPPAQAGVISEAEKKLLWKQDIRIIPISAGIYFLCFLDRANIGNAKVLNVTTHDDLQHTAGMSNKQFNVALMVFLVAYAVFEVPSNILLKKLRPSRWLAFLMFCWGVITMCMGATNSFGSVTGVRFLLGVFEAGLFPGLVYYITFWYRDHERSVRVAFILASATLAGAFGGAIAYGIGHMNQVHGLAGWRWLFILEGIPSCLSAFLVLFFLPDYPESATWLSEQEKDLAIQRLFHEGSKGHHPSMTWQDAKATLTDWRLYAHYAIYFAVSPPFAICQVLVAISADRFNARGYHAAGAALVGAVGFIASAALPATSYKARYGGLILATAGSFASIPPMLGWLTSNVVSTASTGLAIAINVSIGGGLGQIPGVWIYKADEAKRGYPTGHWTNAGFLLFVVAVCLGLRVFYGRKNKALIAHGEREGVSVRLYKL